MKFKKIFAYILIAILCVNECFLTAQQTVFAEEKEESIATSTDAIEDISDAREDISEAQEDIENEEINAEENAGTFGVDNLEFESSDPFSDIFMNEYADEVEEQTEVADYIVQSVEIEDGHLARVFYNTIEDAMLILSIVEENDETSQLTFSKEIALTESVTEIELTQTLPEFYVVRAYIVTKDELRPLSKEYESIMYTAQMQELFHMTTDDFSEERVLNFDDDKANNFAVYDEDVITIDGENENNQVTFVDDETKTYVIEDIDDSVRMLEPGDIFTYNYNEAEDAYLIVKIESIEIDGTTANISGCETTLEEVFEYVKIDENADTADAELGDEELDGIECEGIIETQEIYASPRGVTVEGSVGGSVKYKFFDKESENDTFNGKIEGSITFGGSVFFKLYISGSSSFLEFGFDYSGTAELKVNGSIKMLDIPLKSLKFNMGALKIVAKISFIIETEIEGTIKASISGRNALRISIKKDVEDISTAPKGKIEAELSGKVFVGFGAKIEAAAKVPIVKRKLCTADIGGKMGLEAEAKYNPYRKNDTGLHECNLCYDGTLRAKAELKISTYVLGMKKLTKEHKFGVNVDFAKFYFCINHGKFEWGRCPYDKYALQISAYNRDNNEPIQDVSVEVIDNKRGTCAKIVTGKDGKCSINLLPGKYTVKSLYNGVESFEKVEIIDDSVKLDFQYEQKNGVVQNISDTVKDDKKSGDYQNTIEATVVINETNFPDAKFRKYLLNTFDQDGDNIVKIKDVEEIECFFDNIDSLEGVQYFTSLKRLYCSYNNLTSLNVGGLSNLEELFCYNNNLTSLDVTGLSKLQHLDCFYNNLTSLNVGGLSKLQHLDCSFNNLTSLDVTGLSNLEELDCSINNLTSLDVTGLSNLEELSCSSNNLTSLDVTGLSNLEELNCHYNNLTSLNVTGLSNLLELSCDNNNLTSLDVTGLSNLEYLNCNYNNLTSLDVTRLSNLKNLYCVDNNLTSLNVGGLSNLLRLYCFDNKLTSLNVGGLSNLEYLNCHKNNLTSLNVGGLSNLLELSCDNNNLTSLNVTGLSKLLRLFCSNNNLTSLDVTGLSKLYRLSCSNNNLTSLNVGGLSKLYRLSCSNNNLTSLNVGGLSNLEELSCDNNNLTSLDVTGLSNLGYLDCSKNYLKEVDTSSCTRLNEFIFSPQKDSSESEGNWVETQEVLNEAMILSEETSDEEILVENTFDEEIPAGETADEENSVEETETWKLFPDEVYNIYVFVMDDEATAEDSLLDRKLLYVRQCVTDAEGQLPQDLIPEYKTYDCMVIARCAKQNLEIIDGIKVEIEDLEYTGEEQEVCVTVTRNGEELFSGYDYVLQGDFKATEQGVYTVQIVGIGMYTGVVTVQYSITGDPSALPCEHLFLNYIPDKNATCFEDGTKTAQCEYGCGAKDVIVDEGSKLNFGWNKIDNAWYYYNQDGKRVINWQKIGDKWYYFNASGVMQTGWKQIGTAWYYFNTNGVMQTGWKEISTKWYYFADSGVMQKGWQQISGKWYYFNTNGVMQTGWQKLGTKWYYFTGSGAMVTGWQQIGGKWYYFANSGAMATGWQLINSKWYYFETSGVMVTGWKQVGTKWYYFEKSGAMAVSKWINGTYYVKANGVMATNEWVDGGRYYVDGNGKWVKGKTR